jgi:hypothetical protein
VPDYIHRSLKKTNAVFPDIWILKTALGEKDDYCH